MEKLTFQKAVWEDRFSTLRRLRFYLTHGSGLQKSIKDHQVPMSELTTSLRTPVLASLPVADLNMYPGLWSTVNVSRDSVPVIRRVCIPFSFLLYSYRRPNSGVFKPEFINVCFVA